jgi:Leucine-rich repeat (LRR) protein
VSACVHAPSRAFQLCCAHSLLLHCQTHPEPKTLNPLTDLQHNHLHTLEGLPRLSSLRILDVASNQLTKLSDLANPPALETLIAAGNLLADVESVSHLTQCQQLAELDLGHNRLR